MEFLQSMYETLAMVNYPFATDFLVPLPANPVRVVCEYLNEPLKDLKLFEVCMVCDTIYTFIIQAESLTFLNIK